MNNELFIPIYTLGPLFCGGIFEVSFKKNISFAEDHQMNMSAKFDSNWPCCFKAEN
jgi:hypothetical protein